MTAIPSFVAAAVGYAALLVVLVGDGVSAAAVLAYTAYLALVVLLPGALLWDLVQRGVSRNGAARSTPLLEKLVAGATLGYVVEIASYALARWLDLPRLYLLGPAAVVLVCLTIGRARLTSQRPTATLSWAPALTIASIAAWTGAWISVQLFQRSPLSVGALADPDDAFHLALVGELRHHFPAVFPFVSDEPLTYQYFYHLHAAASTWTTGATTAEVYLRLDPMAFAVMTVLGVFVVARRVTGSPWAGVVGAGILTLVGAFDLSGIKPGLAVIEDRFLTSYLVHSPTQAMAFATVASLLLLALDLLDQRVRVSPRLWVAFAVVTTFSFGTKVTFLPMVMSGLVAAAGIGWLLARRPRRGDAVSGAPVWRRAAGAALVCVGSIALMGLAFYRGETRTVQWGPGDLMGFYAPLVGIPSEGFGPLLYGSLSVALCVSLPAIGSLGLLRRDLVGDLRVWFLLVTGLAGLGATFLLSHPGLSQRYFLASSAVPLAVCAAWGLWRAVGESPGRRTVVGLAGMALVPGLVLFGVRLYAEGRAEVYRGENDLVELSPGIPGVMNLPIILVVIASVIAFGALQSRSLRQSVRQPHWLVVATGCGLATGIAFSVGHGTDPQVREVRAVPSTGVAVATWLRDNAPTGSLTITNAHCGPVDAGDDVRCDHRHFWMSAVSERRFLIEGWGYVGASDGWTDVPYPGALPTLLQNDAVFTDPTSGASRRFLARQGVDYLFVDRDEPHRWSELSRAENLELTIQRDDYAVFRVLPGA